MLGRWPIPFCTLSILEHRNNKPSQKPAIRHKFKQVTTPTFALQVEEGDATAGDQDAAQGKIWEEAIDGRFQPEIHPNFLQICH